MTSFALKIIAMITMLIDHSGDAYFKRTTAMNFIGRIAFPIFAFQITEGYTHTKKLKKYFLRLFIFALLSQIPFWLFESTFTSNFTLNIFFTLFFGLLAIFCYDKLVNSKFIVVKNEKINTILKIIFGILPAIIFGIIAELAKFDYGFFGIAIIFIFYIFRNKKLTMSIIFILACIIKYFIEYLKYGNIIFYSLITTFTISSIIFILLYNGKQGKKIKYFLYAFYPVHLLILFLLFK